MLSNHEYDNRKELALQNCQAEKNALIAHLAQLDADFAYIKADAEAFIAKLDEMIESDNYDYFTMMGFNAYIAAVNAVFKCPSELNQQELYKTAQNLYNLEYENSQIFSAVSLGIGLAILLGAILTIAIFAGATALTGGIAGIVICAVLFGLSATAFSMSAISFFHRKLSDGASHRMLKLADPKTFTDIHENYWRKNTKDSKTYMNNYNGNLQDCKKNIIAKPSKLTGDQVKNGYISCQNNVHYYKFKEENETLQQQESNKSLVGKWVLKFPSKSPAIDDAWRKIENAVMSGTLGYAKASPVRAELSDQIICVYTDNYLNKNEIWYTFEELRRLGISLDYIHGYKRDEDTANNKDEYIYVPLQYFEAIPVSPLTSGDEYPIAANKTEPGNFPALK